MIQSVTQPDVRWILAIAASLLGGARLALVQKNIGEGVVLFGTDRVERSADPTYFWTIIGLFSAVGFLFAALGGCMIVTLIRDHAPPTPPLFVSTVWAVLIGVGERAFWKEYQGGRETQLQRLMRIVYGLSGLLVIIALLASFCGAIAFKYAASSAVPIHHLNTVIDYHGIRYVSAGTAAVFQVLSYLWLVIPLPAIVLGYSVGLQRLRTRRLARG